ncbi:undecaprenyl-diphosphatase UppP [Candidatus Parcubacteria bacterium]|nr:undecaprenyl-diphosphatase UppP [Candidatus Parcubacteria bacterium]
MDLLLSILLGFVQAVTEFLPISSSGHLILFRDLTNTQFEYGLAYDSVLQFATTLAVVVYFRKDILRLIDSFFKIFTGKLEKHEDKILIGAIIIGTIPAVVFGLLLEDLMDTIFRSSLLVAATLILGAIIMHFADKISKQDREINIKNGLIIGLFQSLALIPGMSRSGMTISGGLLMGLKREAAIRFSFLLAIPVLLGSGVKKMLDLESSGLLSSLGLELVFGAITAFIFGILAIKFLITYLKNNSFKVFIWYRLILASVIVLIWFF